METESHGDVGLYMGKKTQKETMEKRRPLKSLPTPKNLSVNCHLLWDAGATDKILGRRHLVHHTPKAAIKAKGRGIDCQPTVVCSIVVML